MARAVLVLNRPNLNLLGTREPSIYNALWSAWLRRPVGGAVRQTAHLATLATRQPGAWAGVLLAMGGLPWVLRERRPIPPELEAALGALAD